MRDKTGGAGEGKEKRRFHPGQGRFLGGKRARTRREPQQFCPQASAFTVGAFFAPWRAHTGREIGVCPTRPGCGKSPANARKSGILGASLQSMSRSARPGSHSSRPRGRSFAAHAFSIADAAAFCKRGERANGALERANFARKPCFSPPIGATGGVHGACEACAARAEARHKASFFKRIFTAFLHPIVRLPYFQWVEGLIVA